MPVAQKYVDLDKVKLWKISKLSSGGQKRKAHGEHNEELVLRIISDKLPNGYTTKQHQRIPLTVGEGSLPATPDITLYNDKNEIVAMFEIKAYMDGTMLKRSLFEATFSNVPYIIVAYEEALTESNIKTLCNFPNVRYFCFTEMRRYGKKPRYDTGNCIKNIDTFLEYIGELFEKRA